MTKWKRVLCLYPFFQKYIEDADLDKFASGMAEYLAEFMMQVDKRDSDREWQDQFAYFIEELQGIIDYLEVHSEDGDRAEVDYELDNLYDLCNRHKVWVMTNHKILSKRRYIVSPTEDNKCDECQHYILGVKFCLENISYWGSTNYLGCHSNFPDINLDKIYSTTSAITNRNGYRSRILETHKVIINA